MNQHQAKEAEASLRAAGWDVRAVESPLPDRWELHAQAKEGGYHVGFSHNDIKVLILGGEVAQFSSRYPSTK